MDIEEKKRESSVIRLCDAFLLLVFLKKLERVVLMKTCLVVVLFGLFLVTRVEATLPAAVDLGNVAVSQGKWDVAITEYTLAIKDSPKTPLLYVNRAMVEVQLGQFDLAVDDFRAAIELSPDNEDLYTTRGTIEVMQRDLPGGSADIKKALSLNPKSFDALIMSGQIKQIMGDSKGAAEDFESALLVDPVSPTAHSYHSMVESQMVPSVPYREDYTNAFNTKPTDAPAYSDYGQDLLQDERYEDGLKAFEKAMELDPTFPESYHNRANYYAFQHKFDLAIKDLSSAIDNSPKYGYRLLTKGSAEMERGDLSQAVKDNIKGYVYIAMLGGLYKERSQFYRLSGDADHATADENLAMNYIPSIKPKRGPPVDNSVNVPNAPTHTITELDAEIASTPTAPLYFERGELRKKAGDYVGAMDDFSKVIDLNPGNSHAYWERGFYYGNTGRLADSITEFNQAMKYGGIMKQDYDYLIFNIWLDDRQTMPQDQADRLLQSYVYNFMAARKDSSNDWSNSLGQYLVGKTSETDLFNDAKDPKWKDQGLKYTSQAFYWVGMMHFLDGDLDQARANLDKCIVTGADDDYCYAAKLEEARMNAAGFTPPVPAPAPVLAAVLDSPGGTEDEWLAGSIFKDVCCEIYMQDNPGRPLPDDGFKVTANASEAPKFSLQAATWSSPDSDYKGTEERYTLSYIWDAPSYEVFAKPLLSKNRAKPTDDSEAPNILTKLLDLKSETLANEDLRLSKLLTHEPLNPQTNEEAALVLLAFAWRENSGPFSEIRPVLSRATAHLAVADAVTSDRSWNNRVAETAIKVFACREVDALADIKKLESDATCPEGAKAWLEALKAKAAADWRPLTVSDKTPLLQKIAWFQTYVDDINSTMGGATLNNLVKRSIPIERITDWGRAMDSNPYGVSVENGHQLFDNGSQISAELDELQKIIKIEGGTPLTDDNIGTILSPTETSDNAVNEAGKSVIQVIGLPSFISATRRHIFNDLLSADFWYFVVYGDKEAGEAFSKEMNKMFGSLPGYEVVSSDSSETPGGSGSNFLKQLRSQGKVLHLTDYSPLQITSIFRNDEGASKTIAAFYKNGSPYGTAFQAESRMTKLFSDPHFMDYGGNLTDSHLKNGSRSDYFALNPDDLSLAIKVATTNPAEVETSVKALDHFFDYNLHALEQFAQSKNPQLSAVTKESLLKKEAKLFPDYYFELSDFLKDQHRDDEAAAAARMGVESAIDQVGISNSLEWLIQYDLDHNNEDEAKRLGVIAASTGSEQGLQSQFNVALKFHQDDVAEQAAKAMLDNYDDGTPLRILYRKEAAQFPGKYEEMVKKAFPNGRSLATMSTLKDKPVKGMLITDVDVDGKHNNAPFAVGDVVVSLNGVLVESEIQYFIIRDELETPDMKIIVWRQGQYQEISANPPDHRFGFKAADFPPAP